MIVVLSLSRFQLCNPPGCDLLSRVLLFGTQWAVARRTRLSMGFPRQEYWSGLPFPSPGDLPNPGIKPVDSLPPSHQEACIAW